MKRTPQKGPKTSVLQRIVMDYIGEIVDSSRDFELKTDLSHAMFGRYKEQSSFMTLDKLEHIISKFPALKDKLADHLSTTTDEKLTDDVNKENEPKGQQFGYEDLDVLRSAYLYVKADRDKKNKKISELEAQIQDLKAQLEKAQSASPAKDLKP